MQMFLPRDGRGMTMSFVPTVCLSIRKSCQRRDYLELGNIRNWVEHCITWRTCKIFRCLKTYNRSAFCAICWPLHNQASFYAFFSVLTDRAPLPGVQLIMSCQKMNIFLEANRLKICHQFQNLHFQTKDTFHK